MAALCPNVKKSWYVKKKVDHKSQGYNWSPGMGHLVLHKVNASLSITRWYFAFLSITNKIVFEAVY